MSLRVSLLFLLIIFVNSYVAAQQKVEYKQPRILILLDGSSSMLQSWTTGESRFQAAGDIVLSLIDSVYSINPEVAFSLRVYGHQHTVEENNCTDTKREVMFSRNNYTQMSLRLASLSPLGVSPIAFALKEAAENDFVNENDFSYSLVLITDGGESCGGDICKVVQELLEKKIQFKPYIVSLVDYEPLREQYKCLGNYLTVARPQDVELALHKISSVYRKVFAVPVVKPKIIEKHPPVVVTPPKKELAIASPTIASEPLSKPSPPEEKKPAPAVSTSKIQVSTSFYPKDTLNPVQRISFKRIHFPQFWAIILPEKIIVPPVTPPKPDPSIAANQSPPSQSVASKIMPVVSKKPKTNVANFRVEVEPAPQTQLQVYFTDGKGKYYSSTPPMKLIDPSTGQEVKKFFRTTDANGIPDPQDVPAGTYTLLIGKSENFVAKQVNIQPAHNNKMTVVVTRGSLHFYYGTNPKRPVSEFVATVKRNFEAAPTVLQKGTEELEYEPGNYHIEFNTLPIDRRNVDLEFGVSVGISLPEPGYVQFMNTNPVGKIYLWYPLGDQFTRFYGMTLEGVPDHQKLRLQPGIYEVHWKEHPQLPLEPDQIKRFHVKSNETTQITLP